MFSTAREEGFRQLAAMLPEIVFELDEHGRLTFVNDRFGELTGHSAEAFLVGQDPLSVLVEEDRARARKNLRRRMAGGSQNPDDTDYGLRRADGSVLTVQVRLTPFFEGERLLGVWGVMTDVSEQRRTERRLQESHERFRELAELMPEIVFEMDESGRLTFVNQQGMSVLGLDAERLAEGVSGAEVFADGDRDKAVCDFLRLREGKRPEHDEYLVRAADGSVFPAISRLRRVFRRGRFRGARGILIDITERKRAEQELARRSEELEQSRRVIDLVLSSLPDLLFVLDQSGRFLACYANPNNPDLVERPENFLGRTTEEVMPPEAVEPLRVAWEQLRRTGARVHAEYSIREQKQHYRTTLSRLPGTPHVLAVVRNVTERKAAAEHLLRMEKMAALGQLMAGVAHEINNPINFINGNMALLREGLEQLRAVCPALVKEPVDAALEEHEREARARCQERWDKVVEGDASSFFDDLDGVLRDCAEGVRRVRRIVSSMRDVARPSPGVRVPLDVHACIESTLVLLAPEYKGRVAVERHFAAERQVRADPTQLSQVLMNLLANAVQAIEGAGRLIIATREEEEELVVTVQDDGCGMTPEVMRRVFEPFYTTKEVGQGSGLGLSISYSIAEAHGGTITAESEPGQGSTFELRLPLESAD